jgi:hypothetical protein
LRCRPSPAPPWRAEEFEATRLGVAWPSSGPGQGGPTR